MTLLEAYEAIVEQGASPTFAPRVASMRRAFELRTGAFTPEDAWFEARSRAFWDDAVTRQSFAHEASASLREGVRALAPAFERAHRGLFMAERPQDGSLGRRGRRILRDAWSGASFVVDEIDDGMHDALDAASAPFDARVVGAVISETPHVALLPGAVFHPADAIEPIAKVLDAARTAGLGTHDALDALLRMERALRSLARMKATYAYRPSALAAPATSASALPIAAPSSARMRARVGAAQKSTKPDREPDPDEHRD
jgi:hypothetical protein